MNAARRMSRIPPAGGEGGDGNTLMKFRRMSRLASVAFRRLSSIPRQSLSSSRSHEMQPQQPLVRLENTYRMQPKSDEKFNSALMERTIKSVLESFLSGETYDASKSSGITRSLTDMIKARIKEIGSPRYKLVVNVILGEKKDQGIQVASRGVWNAEFDNYASAEYANATLFAVATVYAVYFE
ncbi:dynein light chain Tctex-type protein 2B-like [Tubulanus polymorphus]|uniref:dynein light chain Tctex-type protein 2B-like n=1 Tax=Tubulanus polymorphus TaxID=672921 RepID=UPI003DA47BD5